MLKKKIIICDDDEGILEMLSLALFHENTEIITESNSLNLQALISKHHPDLLLLDLWMPLLSGDLILKQLRKQDATKDLPVIIISASRDGESIAKECGATQFLSKPFDLKDLGKRVSDLLIEK